VGGGGGGGGGEAPKAPLESATVPSKFNVVSLTQLIKHALSFYLHFKYTKLVSSTQRSQ
jgi:hypothetical protein